VSVEVAVPAEQAGARLDRFVAGLEVVGSRAEAERLLAAGHVLVDGKRRPKSFRLAGGERLEVVAPERPPPIALVPEQLELTVRYEDENLLVVDKPAGMVVHPSAGHARGTLVHGLLDRGIQGGDEPERPGIVHRLDRETSGLLVVTRDAETHRRMQNMIRRRQVAREYLALVRGQPRSLAGRIEAPIGRDRRDATRISLDTERPRAAITHFELAELLPRHALLRLRLETGRTHQIRVHLAAIDLPVSGDRLYGAPGDLDLNRQFLHAARLEFRHPITEDDIEVESPLPPDLEAALSRARGIAPEQPGESGRNDPG
jgi:23S rRNA pseudouridine1911/1915/1917 synthase